MNTTTAPTTIGAYSIAGLAEVAESAKETAALLRTLLRQRTGLKYSVTKGRGTAAHHVYIATTNDEDAPAQRATLAEMTGRTPMGYPLAILIGSNEMLRMLVLAAGADHAAEWINDLCPPTTYGWD